MKFLFFILFFSYVISGDPNIATIDSSLVVTYEVTTVFHSIAAILVAVIGVVAKYQFFGI
jgi:hypothetical protein